MPLHPLSDIDSSQSLHSHALPAPPTAPGYQQRYKGGTTDFSYILNTVMLNQSTADQACNDVGGRLASWSTQAEQYEVELFYIAQGLLIPNFHK